MSRFGHRRKSYANQNAKPSASFQFLKLSFRFNDVVISNLVRVIFLCPTLTDQSPSTLAVRRYSETETETEFFCSYAP